MSGKRELTYAECNAVRDEWGPYKTREERAAHAEGARWAFEQAEKHGYVSPKCGDRSAELFGFVHTCDREAGHDMPHWRKLSESCVTAWLSDGAQPITEAREIPPTMLGILGDVS